MMTAARSRDSANINPDIDLVVRCSNVQRNIFNEQYCRISYHHNACVSVPLPVDGRSVMFNPGVSREEVDKYLPSFAGPGHGGVIGTLVCSTWL